MSDYVDPIAKLINQFRRLPAVGAKTAQRYALAILDMQEQEVADFANSLMYAKQNVKHCSICGNFTDSEPCHICKTRPAEIICVVKESKDILAIEKASAFSGVYHVLNGVLSPMNGIGPNQLNIKSLLSRITDSVKEVIIATNPDVEGEATALYLAKLLKPLSVKVTRLAQGIAIGSDLQYADEVTLSQAIVNRKEL